MAVTETTHGTIVHPQGQSHIGVDPDTGDPFVDLEPPANPNYPERQLSLNVGGRQPDKAYVTVAGKMAVDKDIAKGSRLRCQIVDADGTVLAVGDGQVLSVKHDDKLDEDGDVDTTTRTHTLKLG